MNRNAIAMAADSAVTVGDHVAIHNSANKLFSLSRVAPVGLIIYANAALMTVPVEIIVKQYKKQLRDKVFPHLEDYVNDFLQYIENNSSLFRFEINEKDYIIRVFLDLMQGMLGDYNNALKEMQASAATLTSKDIQKKAGDNAVKITLDFIDSLPNNPAYHFCEHIKTNYTSDFVEILEKNQAFSWLKKDQINKIAEKSCKIYDTDFDRKVFVGIAIAGFGEEEIYPHMAHLRVSGFIQGKLKYRIQEKVEISETTPASIAPLAQTDVMQTFLFGINDEFLDDLSKEIPKQIGDNIDGIESSFFAEGKKDIVREKLNNVTGSILKHMSEAAVNKYMRPIIQSVASLPIEEIALLAESMINITSLRRKVALDSNIGTVGGPIDVSIISKGDGFIWLKRKHYFDGKYNPQYFYSHFDQYKGERLDGDD
jgi:hypothetical protein